MKFLKELSISMGIGFALTIFPMWLTYRTQDIREFWAVWLEELVGLALVYIVYDLLKHE